jgi:hypothetical protein
MPILMGIPCLDSNQTWFRIFGCTLHHNIFSHSFAAKYTSYVIIYSTVLRDANNSYEINLITELLDSSCAHLTYLMHSKYLLKNDLHCMVYQDTFVA